MQGTHGSQVDRGAGLGGEQLGPPSPGEASREGPGPKAKQPLQLGFTLPVQSPAVPIGG